MWPPTIRWPERIVLRVQKHLEKTAEDGSVWTDERHYLLAYEQVDAKHARFWEAGQYIESNQTYARAMEEALVYPVARIGPRATDVEKRGFEAFAKALLATKALNDGSDSADQVRAMLAWPGMADSIFEETYSEWWFIVGAWDVPLRVAESGEDRREEPSTAAPSFEVTLDAKTDSWQGHVIAVAHDPVHVRFQGTWSGTLADAPFPIHFHRLVGRPVDESKAIASLVIETVADRATMVPVRMDETWEVHFPGDDGSPHVVRRVEHSTYEEVDWSLITWKPVE